MTEEKLCGGKTFKEVMQEVEFHISDKQRIEYLEKENVKLKNTLKDWDIWEEGRKKEIAELKEELRQKSDTNHSLVEQLADKEIIISELKAEIEKERQKSINIQKICFDSCL